MAFQRPRTAELHMHFGDRTPFNRSQKAPKKEHGMPMREVQAAANAILNSGVSFYANTQHNRVGSESWRLHEMVAAQLALEESGEKGTKRSVTPILGAEVTLRHEGDNFHVGVLFEDWYRESNVPALPPAFSDLVPTVEALRREANCVLVLNHPFACAKNFWSNAQRRMESEERVHLLIGSGLFDGIETINAPGFIYTPNAPAPHYMTARARLSVDHWRRKGVSLSEIGGSDAHDVEVIGAANTIVEAMDRRNLCKALRAGEGQALARHPNVVRGVERAMDNEADFHPMDFRIPTNGRKLEALVNALKSA